MLPSKKHFHHRSRASGASLGISARDWLDWLYSSPDTMHTALSTMPSQFLVKDVVLLGAATWSLGEALIPQEKPTIEP